MIGFLDPFRAVTSSFSSMSSIAGWCLPRKITKKEHVKLVIVSIGGDVVAKIDDDVYVLSIIKIYCYFSRSSC